MCITNLTSELNTTCFISLKINDSIRSIYYIISINAKGYSKSKTGILYRSSSNLLIPVIPIILSLISMALITYVVIFYNRKGKLPQVFQKFFKTQPVPSGNFKMGIHMVNKGASPQGKVLFKIAQNHLADLKLVRKSFE